MKNRLFTLLRITISFSLIGLLIWLMRDKLPDIASTIVYSHKGFLILGISVYFVSILLVVYRLLYVLSVQGIRLTPKDGFYLSLIGYFFNNFLPTAIGGDVVKAYYAGKRIDNKAAGFAGVFMDRFLGLIPFSLIPAVTLVVFRNVISDSKLVFLAYAVLLGSVAILWLFLHKKTVKYIVFLLEPFEETIWYKKLKGAYGLLNRYAKHKIVLIKTFVLSVLAQIAGIITVYIFARALGIHDVSPIVFFVVVPVVSFLSMIPSINGLGIRESGYIYFLKSYMPSEKAFAISLLFLFLLAILGVMGGVVYAFKKKVFSLKMEDIE